MLMTCHMINAELQKCETELSAYLGMQNVENFTRTVNIDGEDCVLSMNGLQHVWIEIRGMKYYFSEVVEIPGSSTWVPWMYVFNHSAFLIDYNGHDIKRKRVPASCLVEACNMDFNMENVDFDIVTDEIVSTAGGGYTLARKCRRVRFVRQ